MASQPVLNRWLARLVAVRPGEGRALLWSFAYFFCLLAGYYVLRPLRDEMGIAGGVRNLQWLFTATFVVLLAAVPLFGAVVAKLPRRRFIPIVYHFFVVNIAIFWLLLSFDIDRQNVARVFFVWISVFNLFAVSVFWSFMADLFAAEQGKRLFGFIAAGGSAGALAGPALTIWLAAAIGPVNLLIVAAVLLRRHSCARQLESGAPQVRTGRTRQRRKQRRPRNPSPRGWAEAGSPESRWCCVRHTSPASRCGCPCCRWPERFYFQQANIVAAASDDPAVRTRIFATIDLVIGILTIVVQCAATGRLITRFGVGPAAGFPPVVFCVGFAAPAASPMLALVIAFQAIQRTANFAISNPAREVLFTVVKRAEKYKAKNVIDIVVFRGADAVSGWLFAALRGLGLELSAISLGNRAGGSRWFIRPALGRRSAARGNANGCGYPPPWPPSSTVHART